jgi:hypothetical protein
MPFKTNRAIAVVAVLLLVCVLCQASDLPRDWAADTRQMLHDYLKFWTDHAIDREYGGVLGRVDRKGDPIQPGDKYLPLVSRTLWSFSEAYRRNPDPQYKEMAQTFRIKKFVDH